MTGFFLGEDQLEANVSIEVAIRHMVNDLPGCPAAWR